MKRIVFLTPPDARHGFSLVGVHQQVVEASGLEPLLNERSGLPAYHLQFDGPASRDEKWQS